jgi:hypothetical protein
MGERYKGLLSVRWSSGGSVQGRSQGAWPVAGAIDTFEGAADCKKGLGVLKNLPDCTQPDVFHGHHDYRPWWGTSTSDCPNSNPCLMDPVDRATPTTKFCLRDILLGDPNAPCTGFTAADTAIRADADPQ